MSVNEKEPVKDIFDPDEENMPTIMTFRPALSETETESEDEEVNIESEEDNDVKLIQALLLSKIRGNVPLNQYISPNKSPKKKSPPESPLDPDDLRHLIEREKLRIQQEELAEVEREARKKLFLKRSKFRHSVLKRSKTKAKAKPVMIGLCGCLDRCEWYGYGKCLNLANHEESVTPAVTPPTPRENHNNTI